MLPGCFKFHVRSFVETTSTAVGTNSISVLSIVLFVACTFGAGVPDIAGINESNLLPTPERNSKRCNFQKGPIDGCLAS
jgi:hypothetical protein